MHIITFIYPISCSGETAAVETSSETESKFFLSIFAIWVSPSVLTVSLCVMVTSQVVFASFFFAQKLCCVKVCLILGMDGIGFKKPGLKDWESISFTIKVKKMCMRITVLLPKALLGSSLRKNICYLTE